MKINLPLLTMLEGLKRGGAIALTHCGIKSRQEHGMPSDPCGLIRITASKRCLTFASGDRNRWASHTVAVGENAGDDHSVEVEQEGAWCFDIGQLYPVLKTMAKSARAPGSAYRFEMQYSPAASKPTPQAERAKEWLQLCGHLGWAASDAGDRAGGGSLGAFPADAIQGVEGTEGLSSNPPSVQPTDEFVWEVEAKAVHASLALLSSVKVNAKHDPALAEIGLAIQHGCGSFFCTTENTTVGREITPSEIIDQDMLKAKFLLSRDGLDTLASILATATERQSSSYAESVKLFLLHDQQTVRFEIGLTNLFVALRHTEEKTASSDTIASLSTNLTTLLALRPASSFTVGTKSLLRALDFALSPTMDAQRIDASLDPKESVLELRYAPNPALRKSGQSLHSASGDMRCHNFQQQQTPQGNDATPITFSFAPEPVVEFVKACQCDKVTLELLCETNVATLLRVRPTDNGKETFICSLMAN